MGLKDIGRSGTVSCIYLVVHIFKSFCNRDSFIMEYVGEVVDAFDFYKRVEKYEKRKTEHHYFMVLQSDEFIDATRKGNVTRFINHSCDPNSQTQKVSFVICN